MKRRYKEILPVEGRVSEQQPRYSSGSGPARDQLPFEFAQGKSEGATFRDPAFLDNKTQPVHRWTPWIAGFSAQFVEDCFEAFLSRKRHMGKPLILDPFAGVGTTLVTSLLEGYESVGFEINPYAALACKVKLRSPLLNVTAFQESYDRLRQISLRAARPRSHLTPDEFRSRIPFFSPRVERQVTALLGFIQSLENQEVADIYRLALGAVMVSVSNYTYEPSLGSRPGAGKPVIEDADVKAVILGKLEEIITDVRWLKHECERLERIPSGHVYVQDFLESSHELASNSIDLMVTSPPYMNNYHYVRNTRPQLFWLELIEARKELKYLEEHNLGKYWQTVRDKDSIELIFENKALKKILSQLRRTRVEKGAYGGPGWANYVASYFNDSYRFLENTKRTLRRRGTAVIVIGNSIIQGHPIATDQVLGDIGEQLGFAVSGIQKIRSKRVGSSITNSSVRRGKNGKAALYESAVILKKR